MTQAGQANVRGIAPALQYIEGRVEVREQAVVGVIDVPCA